MRILVHDYAGHPLQVQLSRELARRGHHVVHAYSAHPGQRRGALQPNPSDAPTFRILPVRLEAAAERRGIARRLRHELAYGAKLATVVERLRPDVVLSANAPLLVQRRLLWSCGRRGVAFVYWLQDLLSIRQSANARRRLGRFAAPAVALIRWLERSSLAGAQGVVPITPGFVPALSRAGVGQHRITVMPNWGPLDEVQPMERRNAWAIEHGLADGPVFMYAGSLGLNHDPRLLVELARSLPDVTVVVISDGSGMDFVRSEAARDGLANLRLLPVQPYEQLSAALATADVLLALIEREAAQYSVPSKVLTYLCAGRPILASVPPGNLAAEVIRQAGAGYVVDTHDEAGWLACARDLATDADLRGELGRRARGYAEETFAIDRIGDRFEVLLQRAIATVGAAEGSQA